MRRRAALFARINRRLRDWAITIRGHPRPSASSVSNVLRLRHAQLRPRPSAPEKADRRRSDRGRPAPARRRRRRRNDCLAGAKSHKRKWARRAVRAIQTSLRGGWEMQRLSGASLGLGCGLLVLFTGQPVLAQAGSQLTPDVVQIGVDPARGPICVSPSGIGPCSALLQQGGGPRQTAPKSNPFQRPVSQPHPAPARSDSQASFAQPEQPRGSYESRLAQALQALAQARQMGQRQLDQQAQAAPTPPAGAAPTIPGMGQISPALMGAIVQSTFGAIANGLASTADPGERTVYCSDDYCN